MRQSGILLPIFSLPGPYGIGTLGHHCNEFIRFLNKTHQSFWQVLPIGPTSYKDSPYQSFSAFAGNPYFIDLDDLINQGLIQSSDVDILKKEVDNIDYAFLYNHWFSVLRKASSAFFNRNIPKEFKDFCSQSIWLHDYALFMSIKESFDNVSWLEWPILYKTREYSCLCEFEKNHQEDISFWCFVQFMFYQQWNKMKEYANSLNVEIIGDLPIYVSMDSSDVWAHPMNWKLNSDFTPYVVAGCPPDAFAKLGQLWGNPIYDYENHQKENFNWWVQRMKNSLQLFNIIRIDHFRGFEAYYQIPYPAKDAVNGKWVKGPGIELFNQMKSELKDLPIIAENLGFLTPEVQKLLDDTGFPGMKVLEFAFDPNGDSTYLPHNYKYNEVVYTGTHDNLPLKAWISSIGDFERDFCREYVNEKDSDDLVYPLIRLALASVCKIAIIPMQDYLNLGLEARINEPSTSQNNWQWRMKSSCLTTSVETTINYLTHLYRRDNS